MQRDGPKIAPARPAGEVPPVVVALREWLEALLDELRSLAERLLHTPVRHELGNVAVLLRRAHDLLEAAEATGRSAPSGGARMFAAAKRRPDDETIPFATHLLSDAENRLRNLRCHLPHDRPMPDDSGSRSTP